MTEMTARIQETAEYIKNQGVVDAKIGLVLGSGLGDLVNRMEDKLVIDYADIPNFPVSTVVGHAGQLVYGKLAGQQVLAMAGRFHFYEGYSMDKVIFPVRVMKALGIDQLVITNAAGGLNWDFQPGDLMLITDQINFTGTNPLIGPNEDEIGPRFVDMSHAFDEDYMTMARKAADELGLTLKEGVYMGVTGPTYETPAEVRMFRSLGADAVGMSTVSEVIAARHAGMRVLGVSCITNLGAGMQDNIDHSAVVNTGESVKENFQDLIEKTISMM